MKKNGNEKKQLSKVLVKKALGFDLEEIVEEYVIDKENENNLILNKRKVIKKHIPPDMTAVKTLMQLEKNKKSLFHLTDEELQEEKMKLLKQLKEYEKGEKNGVRKNGS